MATAIRMPIAWIVCSSERASNKDPIPHSAEKPVSSRSSPETSRMKPDDVSTCFAELIVCCQCSGLSFARNGRFRSLRPSADDQNRNLQRNDCGDNGNDLG